MKKILLLSAIILAFASCERSEERTIYVCDCEQQKKAAEFVQNSIKNSNNMSDEEMEDVIHQLERTAVKLNCSQKRKMVRIGDGGIFDVMGLSPDERAYPEY